MSGLETQNDVQTQIEEGPTRYAAFAMRLRTLITASSRYIAYTSDIGEAFRPLTNPYVVRGAYGISWAYILGDCGYAGFLAHKEHEGALSIAEKAADSLTLQQKVELRKRQLSDESNVDKVVKFNPLELSEPAHVGLVVARRAVFQSLASMALPAFTIHSIVRYSAPLFARASSRRVRASGPTFAGLAAVPALPYLFDHPVEHAVDFTFDKVEEFVGEGWAKAKKKTEREASIASTKDEIANVSVEEKGPNDVLATYAAGAIIGVGVDMMFLPRLRGLLSRHAARIRSGAASSATTGELAVIALAVQRLARRVLHDSEYNEWQQTYGRHHLEGKGASAHGETLSLDAAHLRWLAVRWTAKEAAFKAVSGHAGFEQPSPSHQLTWHDAYVVKAPAAAAADSGARPLLRYSERIKKTWREHHTKESLESQQASASDIPLPKLHLSITHDGDYVTSFVVAEAEAL